MGIVFKNTGIHIKKFNDNLNIEQEVLLDQTINHYYDTYITFSDDLTYGGFFFCLSQHKDIIDKDFVAYSGGFNLEPFLVEMNKDTSDVNENISHIVFYHHQSINKTYDILSNLKKTYIEEYSTYYGIGYESDKVPYGLSFTKLNSIKDKLFKLDPIYDINIYDSENKSKPHYKLISDLVKDWTLHDLISSFLTELTFHGHPSDVDDIKDSILNDIDYDESCSYSIESLMIELLNDDLEKAKDSENYEACKRITDKIEEYKKDLNK